VKVKLDWLTLSELSLYTEPVTVEALEAFLKKLSCKELGVPHPP
jgi:hypothetical protein